jgi:hypothetical protein
VGSAHSEAELGLLMAEARRLVAGDLQGELDLGLSVPVAHAVLLGPAGAAGLFDEPRRRPGRRPVSAPRVVKTCSAVLFDAIVGVWTDLGFDALGDDVFRDLVIARVVEPTSLLDVDRVLADLGRVSASLSTRKRTLKRCHNNCYRARLAALCFAQASAWGDLSLVLYDVTTLRTEADKEDDLRKAGYSKDRSVDPQVTVGLLVDRAGFPLEIGCFPGNHAETHTLLPIISQFEARHGAGRLVVVADAGMLSQANLTALDEAGHRFIVGSKTVRAPIDLASHFRWHGDAFTDGQIIDTVTPKTGRNRDNNPMAKAEPIWDPDSHPGSWRAVWSYSAKRFARDNQTLTAQENRAREVITGQRAARKPRFVKATATGFALDRASLARARRLAGLKGYVTNIPAADMPAAEVITHYHDLWHIEESFRISKTDLAARPLFARTRDAIEAHLTIVFAALAISRTIQTRTGLSIRRTLRTLRPLRSATIHTNGVTQTIPPALSPHDQALLDAISSRPPRH